MEIPELRLFDFQTYNKEYELETKGSDNKNFTIKMFGIDENRKTYCVHVEKFYPFLYVLVPDKWGSREINLFRKFIRDQLGE